MIPAYTVTGTAGKFFDDRMAELLADVPYDCKYKCGPQADMYLLHQWIKNDPVDLLIGNTYLKYIARDEDIPLVRPRLPDPRPHGASVLPELRLLRRHAPDGEVPVRHHGPSGPRLPRDPLRTADVTEPKPKGDKTHAH